MESVISPTRSVEIVGEYKPLDTGFDYKEIRVVAKPPAAAAYARQSVAMALG